MKKKWADERKVKRWTRSEVMEGECGGGVRMPSLFGTAKPFTAARGVLCDFLVPRKLQTEGRGYKLAPAGVVKKCTRKKEHVRKALRALGGGAGAGAGAPTRPPISEYGAPCLYKRSRARDRQSVGDLCACTTRSKRWRRCGAFFTCITSISRFRRWQSKF
ncbi:hypothetical protein EVAR_82777_1 [Eumeta japonica]|uniref:Uncharacterized protein n=1 Tax=Eumeta variegata TaxID=151549 RepID=A0A4C1UMS0_EUMVA|nr:hypothetical protein EVAR_82777_1 [Eumeta japonica]